MTKDGVIPSRPRAKDGTDVTENSQQSASAAASPIYIYTAN